MAKLKSYPDISRANHQTGIMVYRAIGLMSGSSLDGLDIVFAELHENAGKWSYEIIQAECYPYDDGWLGKLKSAISLSALEYQLLHSDYGHYTGRRVNHFIEKNDLHYQVSLIASHGHTTFHFPDKKMTAQLGDGAAIAAETGLPVVTDLRALDIAFGGQGAPIVPIGEKLLLSDYDLFLNIGGIANISVNGEKYIGFDVCPANKILNMLANEAGKDFDEGGKMASAGQINVSLLEKLNSLDYYSKEYPKSLANEFGANTVYSLIKKSNISLADALRTYTEHIAFQIKKSIFDLNNHKQQTGNHKLLITGGGAFNNFLLNRINEQLHNSGIEIVVPDKTLVKYKEALIMALIGVLRWRQENNVLSSVTGALRDSIGGALWNGQEA